MQLSEAYLEPSRTSKMEFFCENSEWLLVVNDFCKKAHRKCSTRF